MPLRIRVCTCVCVCLCVTIQAYPSLKYIKINKFMSNIYNIYVFAFSYFSCILLHCKMRNPL